MQSAPDKNNLGHASEVKNHIPLNQINNYKIIENILIEKAKRTFDEG